MSSCSDYPTASDAKRFKKNADSTNEFVTSPSDTFTDQDGGVHNTIEGISTLAENQRDNFEVTFGSQFNYKRIGNISDYAGQSLPEAGKLNSYQYPDDSGDWYAPEQGQVFPITIPSDPTVSVSDWFLLSSSETYRGLWPDTGGSANKGETWQTQTSGTPTGQYFTALQNTTVDPVSDDVNWREVVSVDSFSKYTNITYKASGGNSAIDNMIAGYPVSLSDGDKCTTVGDYNLPWTISTSPTHDRRVVNLDNGLFALLDQNTDSVVNWSYFSFVYGDDDTAFNQAIKWTGDTGGKLRASKKDSITLTALPSEQIESGADIDLCGMVINTTISSSSRGDGIFNPKGTVSSLIFATLTSDVNPFDTEFTVDNPSNFSVGDFVVGGYTTAQDNQTFPTGGLDYEFIAQISDVTPTSVIIDLPRSYTVSATPPAGGTFVLSKADPVVNFKLKGFTVKDSVNDPAVSHSAFAPYLCADFEVSDVRSTDSRGTTVYYHYCHNYKSLQIENFSPSFTGAGRGYTEQNIASSLSESVRPKGVGTRHVVDYSNGSCQMTVTRGIGINGKDGLFGCHGSYENNLKFINCEGYSANVPMFYLATSGTEFGRNCSDIKIDTPTGRSLGRLIYSGTIDARVNRCELINPNYRDHIGTSPAVSMNMTRFSIEDGLIEGGLIINPSLSVNGVVTDLTIKGTTVLPLGDALIQVSNMFGKKVIFLGADVSGELIPTAFDANFVFDGGTYRYTSSNLMNPAALNNKLDSLKMDGATIEVPTGVNVNDSIKAKSFSWQGNTIEIATGQTAITEFDCTNSGGISISDNDGDMRYTVRRFKELIFDSNRQVNPIDEFLQVIQSIDARLVITSNNLKKLSANAKCIDIVGGGQTGLNIVCNSNTHNGIIDFAQGSESVTTGGVATGNAYVPDSGDTNTQTLRATVAAGVNFGAKKMKHKRYIG